MTLESVHYLTQILASIAVVASLAVLIQQSRQANRLLREAAKRAQVEGLRDISAELHKTPGLAEIWSRGNATIEALDEADRVRYITFSMYCFRVWEGLHAQRAQGLIEDELWQAHLTQIRDVQAQPGPREVRALRRKYFSAVFQAFFEAEVQNGTGDPDRLYGLSKGVGSSAPPSG